ncbi:hypothetical protein [Denitrificimonas caeni]|uniref:hypothetical protein n=1 Tax=Denitrificimonas caeni TaxID=521720 RepID=UPI00196410DD|nr:hypothetical protein [Denitrificimonas caeni]
MKASTELVATGSAIIIGVDFLDNPAVVGVQDAPVDSHPAPDPTIPLNAVLIG